MKKPCGHKEEWNILWCPFCKAYMLADAPMGVQLGFVIITVLALLAGIILY